MRTTHFLPIICAAIALAGCSDNEPAPTPPGSVPPPGAPVKPTTESERARDPMNGATSGTAPANEPAVLRGEQANATGSAKTATGKADAAAGATPSVQAPAVLRGERAQAVDTAVARAGDAMAPAGTVEARVLPDRDATTNADAAAHAVDNSGRNKREDGSQPTPLDQGESEPDRKITQGIRSTVVGRDDLSVNAKNVKIITRDGKVTLRGPVADAREKDAVASIAKAQAGVAGVDNNLEPLQP